MMEAVSVLNKFLREDLGQDGFVPLHAPTFAGNEWDYLKDCLDSTWVSSVGAYVDKFEEEVAKVAGTRFGIATVNGTAALHAALYAIGVKPGDLVLCPTLTFIATANAISYCHADPLFVDSEMETLAMDPVKLRTFLETECKMVDGKISFDGRPITACVPVHIFGHPARMDEINEVCTAFNIPVIEDASEALGAKDKGRMCGSLSKVATFSFNGNKIMTTGGGGMLTTDDEELAQHLKHLTTTAKVPHAWKFDHDEVGFNYRLPNINAALGCAQIEQLPGFKQRKRALAARYIELFDGMANVEFCVEPQGTESIYWLNAILLKDDAEREIFLDQANAAKIGARPCWTMMHELQVYKDRPRAGDLAGAAEISARLVNIPSTVTLVDC